MTNGTGGAAARFAIGDKAAALLARLAPLWRVALACALCAIAAWAAFVAILAVVVGLPLDRRIEASLREAVERGVLLPDSYPVSPYGHEGHEHDLFTDCVSLGTNLGNQERGLLERIAASPYVAPDAGRLGESCQMLTEALLAGDVRADRDYLRFWHGDQAYYRPLLSIMSLQNLRRVTAALFFGALLFFTYQLSRHVGPWAWPVFLLPYVLVGDFLSVPVVTSHALSLVCVFLSAALVPIIAERVPRSEAMILPVTIFLAGAVTSFLSFLLNPPLAPALIAFLVIAARTGRSPHETRSAVLYAGWLAFLWLAGYAAAWIEKWLFAAIVLGPETVLADLTGTLDKYEGIGQSEALSFGTATWRNLTVNGFLPALILAGALASAAIVALAVRRGGEARARLFDYAALLTPLLVVLAWAEAYPSHSAWHSGYVSRSFYLFAILPLLAAILTWRRRALPLPLAGRG